MADAHPDTPRGAGRCGCTAAGMFGLIVGLPLLFIFSWSMSPCPDGPCNPNGVREFQTVAAIVAGLTAAVGIGIFILVRWWDKRQPAGEVERGRKRLALFLTVPLIVAAAVMMALFRL